MSPVRLPFPGSLPEGERPARLRPEPGFRKPPPPAVKPLGGLTGDRMGHWARTLLGTARSPGASCPARAGHSGCQAAGPRISVCTQGPPSPQVPGRPALRRVPLQAAHFPSRQRPSPAVPSRDLALALLADLAAAHWGFRGPARRPGHALGDLGPQQLVPSAPRSVSSGTETGLRVNVRCFGEPDVGLFSGL